MTIVKKFSSVNKKKQPNIIIIFVKRTSVLKVQLNFLYLLCLEVLWARHFKNHIIFRELEHDFPE